MLAMVTQQVAHSSSLCKQVRAVTQAEHPVLDWLYPVLAAISAMELSLLSINLASVPGDTSSSLTQVWTVLALSLTFATARLYLAHLSLHPCYNPSIACL